MPELEQFAHDVVHALGIVGIGAVVAVVAWLVVCGLTGKLGART